MEGAKMETENLCCGRLFFAEIVEGRVVLECCTCGTLWETTSEGGLAPLVQQESAGAAVDRPIAVAS